MTSIKYERESYSDDAISHFRFLNKSSVPVKRKRYYAVEWSSLALAEISPPVSVLLGVNNSMAKEED